ncbi:unnamed protein product [Allacma fusca]|uniref:C2H2-type domain-containing protein n=1 Tax=Allacma fusca TaxID=39272 RepID=A0A8J2LTF0_9HEXA|nr:unnamed protein product [Allacma fusca]
MSCIICNENLSPELNISSCQLPRIRQMSKILQRFCSLFDVTLPLGTIQWDFSKESLPFCSRCGQMVKKLVDPMQKRQSDGTELTKIAVRVKSQIAKINSKDSSSSVSHKRWKNSDVRVEALRDLIMGPCLKLERLHSPSDSRPLQMIKEEIVEPVEGAEDDEINEFHFAPIETLDNTTADPVPLPANLDSKTSNTPKRRKKFMPPLKSDDTVVKTQDLKMKNGVNVPKTENTSDCLMAEEIVEDIKAIPATSEINIVSGDISTETNGNNKGEGKKKSQLSVKDETGLLVYCDAKMTVDVVLKDPNAASDDDSSSDDSSGLSEEEEPLDPEFTFPVDDKEKPKRKRKRKGKKKRYPPSNKGVTELGNDQFLYYKFKYSGNDQDGYKCGKCNTETVYKNRENMYRHIKRSHIREGLNEDGDSDAPGYTCSKCGKCMTTSLGLKYHMQTHDDSFIFICEHCGKECRGIKALQGHTRRVHLHVTRVVDCDGCDKKFKDRMSLNRHKRQVHMKQKNVFCEFCGRGFFKSNQLKTHINSVHARFRPFCCDYCENAFTQKGALSRHLKMIHPDLTRKVPEGEQTEPEEWKKLNLPCKYCCMRYSRHNDLTMHLKRVHEINVKGLNWKSKAPRKILEQVTAEPDLVVQNVTVCKKESHEVPEHVASEVEIQEGSPFCPKCLEMAEKLVMPNRKFNSWEKDVTRTELWIKSKIKGINSNTNCKNTKRWKSTDQRIETLRDLIVGPYIKLKRLPRNNQTSANENLPQCIIYQDTIEPGNNGFYRNELQGLCSVTGSNPGDFRLKDFDNSQVREDKLGGKNNSENDDPLNIEFTVNNRSEDSLCKKSNTRIEGSNGRIKVISDIAVSLCNPLGNDFVPSARDETISESKEMKISGELKNIGIIKKLRKPPGTGRIVRRSKNVGEGNYIYDKFKFTGSELEGFKCDECTDGYTFRTKRNIRRHILKWHLRNGKNVNEGVEFLCPVCGKGLSTSLSLNRHLESHDDNCIAVCEICRKACRGPSALKAHLNTVHTVANQFPCDECKKAFKLQRSLTVHKKQVHKKHKSAFCETCGKGFYKLYQLKIHVSAVHAELKPFCCDHCDSIKENEFENRIGQNQDKFLLHSFCRYFYLKLPLNTIEWDFNKEILPFCRTCKLIAAKLVRLNRKLELLKNEVLETENLVRTKIIKIPNNRLNSESERLKTWRSQDLRIQSIRDIIVGPCLRLERIPLSEVNCSKMTIKKEEPGTVVDEDFSCDAFLDVDFAPDSPFEYENPDWTSSSGSRKRTKDSNFWKNSKRKKLSPEGSKKKGKTKFKRKRSSASRCLKNSKKFVKADANSTADSAGVTIEEDQTDAGEETNDCSILGEEDTGSDSDESFDEDPSDEDFVLPDDTMETIKRDKKLTSRVKSNIRCKNSEKNKVNRGTKVKIERLGEDKYSYAGFEYCGNEKDGYKCCLCTDGHVYPRRRNIHTHLLKLHLKGHENFLCPICGKELKRASLKYHMESHDDNCIAICEICGKECRGAGPLKQHIKLSHVMESKMVCEVCGKKFKANSNLNHHMKAVHLKEKNVFCEICGKGFYGSSYLTHHMKGRHATEKLFSCNLCGQRFVQKGSYTRHLQQFHSQAQSSATAHDNQSVSTASTSYQQQNHQEEAALGESSLRCKYCGLKYNRQNNLTRHLLQIHHINVKGLAWKHKAPRKILEKVYLQPQPDFVNKSVCPSQPEPRNQGSPDPTVNVLPLTESSEPSFMMNSSGSSTHTDEYSSATNIWDRGFDIHTSNT